MDNRGQTLGLTIVSVIFVIIAGFLMLNFLMPEITSFRANMSCASPTTITDGVKLLCLLTDATVPYWILLVMSLVIGSIAARIRL